MHDRSLTKMYDQLGMHVMPNEYLADDYDGLSGGSIAEMNGRWRYDNL